MPRGLHPLRSETCVLQLLWQNRHYRINRAPMAGQYWPACFTYFYST